MALPRGCARGWCRCWEPLHALGVRQRGAPVGIRLMPWEASYVGRGVRWRGVPWPRRRGVPEGGVAVGMPWGGEGCHSPAEGVCRGGVPEGGARALPRGCEGGGVPLLETAACPGRPPMWAEGCAGGVCYSPAEGACRKGGAPEGCHCWELPHALGGLLCGPEGCAIALPRGCARGRYCCWEQLHALGGLLCGRRGAPEPYGGGAPKGACRSGMALLGAAACSGELKKKNAGS